MWLDGVSPLRVLPAYVAALAAFVVFAIPAARQQQAFSPIQRDPQSGTHIDKARLAIVLLVLVALVGVMVFGLRRLTLQEARHA